MNIILSFLLILIGIAVLFIILGVLRTLQIKQNSLQKIFIKGRIPDPLPEGTYKGYTNGYVGPWTGKLFNKQDKAGINEFLINKKIIKRFPFKTFIGSGLQDKSINVLKIEYNIPDNSFFLRMILDEMVQTEEGKYLGKVHLRLIPNMPFTLGYFWLESDNRSVGKHLYYFLNKITKILMLMF